MVMRLSLVFVLVLLIFNASFADVLKYQDSLGRTHYVDSKDKVPPEYQSQINSASRMPDISKVPSPKRKEFYETQPKATKSQPVSRTTVEIFVTTWCPYCQQLENFLKEKRIAYRRYDIEQDPTGARLHQQLGGGGVPLVRVGKEVLHGYDPEGILQALKRKK